MCLYWENKDSVDDVAILKRSQLWFYTKYSQNLDYKCIVYNTVGESAIKTVNTQATFQRNGKHNTRLNKEYNSPIKMDEQSLL